jgi:suppressor of fused protein SUFU
MYRPGSCRGPFPHTACSANAQPRGKLPGPLRPAHRSHRTAIPAGRVDQAEPQGVTVLVYDNLPPGLLTAVTYGLSLADHPDWQHGSPELCVSIRSTDDLWARAVGHLAEAQRGDCTFTYGETINFGEKITPESAMTAFVIFAPAVLDRDDYTNIASASGHEGHDIINLAGIYPIHEIERQYIREHGFKAFWDHDWDMYDITRSSAV